MDQSKRDQLVNRLQADGEPLLVPIEIFFDGNDDLGSIGCNLLDHPGIAAFRDTFVKLSARNDVDAIYAHIAEIDPGEDCWPFTDTVYVVGPIASNTLEQALAHLEPDEVGVPPTSSVPDILAKSRVLIAWWD